MITSALTLGGLAHVGPRLTYEAPSLASAVFIVKWDRVLAKHTQLLKHVAELRGPPETSAALRQREVGVGTRLLPSAQGYLCPRVDNQDGALLLPLLPSLLSPQLPRRNPRLQEPADCKSCTQPLN